MRRWGSVLFAGSLGVVLVVGGAVGLPSVANASTTTGAVTLMVVDPAKQPIRDDFDIETANASLVAADGTVVATRSPDANGRVTFSGVPAGQTLTAHLRNAYGYSKYLDTERAGISVAAGHHVWVEIVAQRGGQISGTISGPPGGYVAGVTVLALDRTGRVVVASGDDHDGTYTVEGLPSGDYTLEFDLHTGGEHSPGLLDYVWQFWDSSSTFLGARFIHVDAQTATTPATAVSGIDPVLQEGRHLIGKVFSSFPQDFSDECQVHFVSTAVGDSFCTSMNITGNGFDEVLVPGDYRIEVTRPSTTRPGTTITYWYAGEGVPPATTEAGAAVVRFTGVSDVTIRMTVH